MGIGERIKSRRKELCYSAEQVAAMIGVSPATIYRYESSDILNMRSDRLLPIADALSTTPAYLMGWSDDPNISPHDGHPDILPISKRRVPLLGDIAAGVPIHAEQEYDSYVAAGDDCACDFALKVRGDSMEPRFIQGDTIFFRSQSDVDDGQIAAVIIDDEATLKRVYHLPGSIQLISENPKYPPMIFHAENSSSIRILGLAVGYYRSLL